MNILHLICSPRGRSSESYRLSEKLIDRLLDRHRGATVTTRMVGGLPYPEADYATALGAAQPTQAEAAQTSSFPLSEELITELEGADIVVIATPMHNFTVPSALKAWIDHIVRIRRTFEATPEGKIGTLRDRPVYVAISSGGRFSGPHARQPDFLTPYLVAILATIGLHDLTFFSVEGTVAGPEATARARAEADQALREHFLQPAFSL